MTQSEQTQGEPLLQNLSAKLVPELRRYMKLHRAEVESMISAGTAQAGGSAGEHYARVIDGLLSSLFHATKVAMERLGRWQPVSVAAVGSYGRKTASLYSDLDIRLLCPDRANLVHPVAEALLYPLWDAGLSIGHQVVTEEEVLALAREDLPTATSLLDWRAIVGEQAYSQALLSRAFDGLFGPATIRDFLERLESSAKERHERFGGSVFLLEPDVKNGAGGLRDLDIAGWAARARWRVTSFAELVRLGVLVPREYEDIKLASESLQRIRNSLHLLARRRSDRLGFEQQEKLAEVLGKGSGKRAVESLMSEYYRNARVIERAREMLVRKAMPPPKQKPRERLIGEGLKLTNDEMSMEDPDSIYSEPALALRLYAEAVKRSVPVYEFARQVVARATVSQDFCERLRQSPEAAKLFVALVQSAQKAQFKHNSVLTELHEVGLLLAMIPEFEPVVGRVHHDIYHVYTVDVHSIAAVDRLRALCRGDLAEEFQLACRLAAEMARPHVVFFAALLHDVGKDLGGKDHSERGAKMCRTILTRLCFDPRDIEEVAHLIHHHLRMYHVATRRDIDDPKTLSEFSQLVHGREGLRELYLLTVVDVSTTSPTSMTAWKARMLDDLYVATDNSFAEGGVQRGTEQVQGVMELVKRGAADANVPPEFCEQFLKAMPERYLFANPVDRVVSHVQAAFDGEPETALVRVLSINEPYVSIGVIADDAPGLLAKICATFSAARIKVVGAQIYSWSNPAGQRRVLDIFWVRAGTDSTLAVTSAPRVEKDLRRLIAGEIKADALVSARGQEMLWSQRPGPPVETRINIDNRSATSHTILEVITRDRRDLLYRLSNAISESGLSIDLAKINTEGDVVADVFYVSLPAGGKVIDPGRVEELYTRLKTTMAGIEGSED